MNEKRIIKDRTSMNSISVFKMQPSIPYLKPVGRLKLDGYSKEDIVQITQYLEYKNDGETGWTRTTSVVYPKDEFNPEHFFTNTLIMSGELFENMYIDFFYGSSLTDAFPHDFRPDYKAIGRKVRTGCDILTSDNKEWSFIFSNLKIGSIDGSNENSSAMPIGCGEKFIPPLDESYQDFGMKIIGEFLDENRNMDFTFDAVLGSVDQDQSVVELIVYPGFLSMSETGEGFTNLHVKSPFTVPIDNFVEEDGIMHGRAKINLNFGTEMFPEYDPNDPFSFCGYDIVLHTVINSSNGYSIHCFGDSGSFTSGWGRFEESFPEFPCSDLLIIDNVSFG